MIIVQSYILYKLDCCIQSNALMEYLKIGQANILVGNVIDWVLHQKTLAPAGPENYFSRNKEGIDKIYGNGICEGIFIHDLGRGLAGRKGPYTTLEWMLSAAKSVSYLKRKHRKLDMECSLIFDRESPCLVEIKNFKPDKIEKAVLRLYSNPDIEFQHPIVSEIDFKGREEVIVVIPFKSENTAFSRAENNFAAVRVEYQIDGRDESCTDMAYSIEMKKDDYPIVAGNYWGISYLYVWTFFPCKSESHSGNSSAATGMCAGVFGLLFWNDIAVCFL